MSELPTDDITSEKQNEFGPNYLGYYKELILHLFSENGISALPFKEPDFLSSIGAASSDEGPDEYLDNDRMADSDNGERDTGSPYLDNDRMADSDKGERDSGSPHLDNDRMAECNGGAPSQMYREICRLSEIEKERLISILNECAVSLNHEVDEVLDRLLEISLIVSDPKSPSRSISSNEDLSMPLRSKKRKAPSPSSSYFKQGKGGKNPEAVTNRRSLVLHSKIVKMEEDLESLLNFIVSRCRPMTLIEKYKLGKKIQKLPKEALDRIMEIIQANNNQAQDGHDSVFVNLLEKDDVTLWRLHYFVELVMKENKSLLAA